MKNLTLYVGLLMAIAGLLVTSGCKDDDPKPINETQLQFEKLSRTWEVTSAKLDGVDYSDYYGDFSLTVSGTSYASMVYVTSNRPPYSCWSAGGTLAFGPNMKTSILRDHGTINEVAIGYTLTSSSLELHFTYEGDLLENARTNGANSVTGDWIFVFEPQP